MHKMCIKWSDPSKVRLGIFLKRKIYFFPKLLRILPEAFHTFTLNPSLTIHSRKFLVHHTRDIKLWTERVQSLQIREADKVGENSTPQWVDNFWKKKNFLTITEMSNSSRNEGNFFSLFKTFFSYLFWRLLLEVGEVDNNLAWRYDRYPNCTTVRSK